MSKIYDDLGTVEGGRRRQKDAGELELFAYAAARKREEEQKLPPPPEDPKPAVMADGMAPLPDQQPGAEQSAEMLVVNSHPSAPYLQRSAPRRNQSIYSSTLSPILGVRPLKGPWRTREIVMAAVVVILALVAVSFFVAGIVGAVSRSAARRQQAAAMAREEAVTSTPRAEAPAAKPAAAKPAARQAVVKPAAPAARPVATVPALKLVIPGATVKAEGSDTVVFFDTGVFSSATRLSPQGRAALTEAGRQIARLGKPVQVTVVGCTDNVAVTRKSPFKDNMDLGLQRAAEALKVLQPVAGLPVSSFKTVSYGAQWSPYPNDTPQNRARNRTVVLRIPST